MSILSARQWHFLIENAARYTPEGSLIQRAVEHENGHCVVFEKDNGPGVPEAERPRVLQRLYRYEGSTSGQGGHGLGLLWSRLLRNCVTEISSLRTLIQICLLSYAFVRATDLAEQRCEQT